jgi:signal transduction histidine kinase
MNDTRSDARRMGSLYGGFAFGVVILSCFAGFFYTQRSYFNDTWAVPVVFALGAVYATLGILCASWPESGNRPMRLAIYYGAQCALLTAMVTLSPLRGFFGMIVLPLASQSVFDFGKRGAALVCGYLFALNIAVWGVPFGWSAAMQAVVNYAAGFAFTIVFTIITKQALLARQNEETLRRELEAAYEKLRAYAAQAEELATTRERNRLAREIHDGVGHYLTVIKTQLDAASALLPAQPGPARATLEKSAKLAAEALDDVRHSVGSLRADATRPPLPEAIRQLSVHGEPVPTIAIEGAPRDLPSAVEHALYRAAQEGLTNIRKHAGATTALLALDFRSPGRVRLELSDNGRGANGANGDGFGLVGLRERIELLGGKVTAGNRLEGGYSLVVEVLALLPPTVGRASAPPRRAVGRDRLIPPALKLGATAGRA